MFWSADMTFAAERSLGVPLGPPTDAPRQVRFTIPRRGVRWLRFHPTDAPGEVRIHRLQFLDERGSSTSVALQSLLPGDGIAIFTADADGVRIVTTPDAKDPSLLLPLGCIEGDVSWFSTVTPLALTLLGAAIVALIGAGTVVMVRTAFAAESRDASRPNSQASAKTAAVWFAVLLLVVLGVEIAPDRRHADDHPRLGSVGWRGGPLRPVRELQPHRTRCSACTMSTAFSSPGCSRSICWW